MLKRIGSTLFTLVVFLTAGELHFTASVNRTEVGVGEPLQLTVTVEGENLGSIPTPTLPDLPDFDIGGRSSSQSTNIQFINGKITKQQAIHFIYTLFPKAVGTYTIGQCTIEFQGETFHTQPISITVVKGSAAQPSQGPSGMAPSTEPSVPLRDNLKVLASANRYSVYVGEQITVEYTLYNRLSLRNINLEASPLFSGFWAEPIYDAQRLDFQRKVIDGKAYDVCVLKKTALFPVTSGKLTISPMKLRVEVIQPPRDFFDVFGTSSVQSIASDPIHIDVKSLPAEGKPESFTGGVGQFSMQSSLDQDISEAAEPINLAIKITGTGNVKFIEKPTIPHIPAVKVLDPEINDNIDITSSSIGGYKEFIYPLIPQMDGEHLIPEIEIAYFDPHDKQYHRLRTEKMIFTATKTAAASEIVQGSGIDILGSDISYIKQNADNLHSHSYSAGWWLVLMYICSLLIVGVSVLYRRHQSRLLTDRAYRRKLGLNRLVRKRLKEAQQALKENNIPEFHAALSRVMLGYIGDRYNLDAGALTKEGLVEELKKRSINEEPLKTLTNLLDQCDLVRFSPGTTCENPKALFEQTKRLLGEL